MATLPPPQRRRIVLMRHGAVEYFKPDGTPLPSETVPLSQTGRTQADAAGRLLGEHGVRFDRVVVSGLPRTVETAQRVLAAAGQGTLPCETVNALREIKPGDPDSIATEDLHAAFTGAFLATGNVEAQRFMGGESVGEMLDRVLPAFEQLLADERWQQMLLVLHGGVNRALLSRALSGGRAFFGRIEQAPACMNLIDVGHHDLIVRATNLAPTQWLHAGQRSTSMEDMLGQYLRRRQPA